MASYARLLRDVRFTAFAVQPGLNSGAFFSLATGGSFLATEALGASASDYGFWFVLLAAGFMVGNFIAGQVGNRRSVKFMTRLSSIWTFGVVVGMLAALLIQPLSMRLIFIPGMLLGIGQGLGLSYAQTGAMAIDPRLAGSASGAVTFFQFLFAALGQQIVGVLANGTWVPLVSTMLVFTGLALTAAIVASRPATTQAF